MRVISREGLRLVGFGLLLLAAAACGGGDNKPDIDPDPDPDPDICQPETRECDGADVFECAADGDAWVIVETCGVGQACVDGACTDVAGIESLTATYAVILEGQTPAVDLTAVFKGSSPRAHSWRQLAGPGVTLAGKGPGGASIDTSAIEVAADTVLRFELSAEWDGAGFGLRSSAVISDAATIELVVQAVDLVPAREGGPIGGATVAAVEVEQDGLRWALHNRGGRLRAARIDSPAAVHSLDVGAYIRDIDIVELAGARYALLALGAEGIAVVDVTDVTAMRHVLTARVNHEKLGVTFAEGGGAILVEDFASTRSTIAALETDGTTLWIANADYGLQRTALSNLLDVAGPSLEADGTLLIEAERYTQQYAGEHPWGGPLSLTRHGGKLFAAQQFLGLGIFDADTLEQVGRYNLYVDPSVVEDWFIAMDVATQVHSDEGGAFLDAFTGMPDYRQTNFEIMEVWKNEVDAPTPWADFDRYGKYYYNAQDVAVADHGPRTIAYVAYGLGGLIAVDVTGYDTATSESFLIGQYLGYTPGVPAHGPDKPRQDRSGSLYPYYGAGKLKEAGATRVIVSGTRVLYTDHFAGLVVLDGADQPEVHWRQAGGPFDNDDPGQGSGGLGDHYPDYEFVTSYSMAPWDPSDHESLPVWMYQGPAALTTGEIGGHGRALALLGGNDTVGPGLSDVLLLSGAGGMSFLDLTLTGPAFEDRFTVTQYLPSTDEIGAAVDGTPSSTINIGHTQGMTTTAGYLYVADGPHGVSVWDILDEDGAPIDDPHVVANTLQDEYPQETGGVTVYPATHAWATVYDAGEEAIYATCQSVGLRRISVAPVEAGQGAVGAPLLIGPKTIDIFEHNGPSGSVEGLSGQDHAYDVFRRGNLAFVADGTNGLTIYDVTRDPTDLASGFVVGNVGSDSGRPPLGRATSVTVWRDETTGFDYAFMSAGQFGIGVVDVTDVTAPRLVKVFEPIKIEDGKVGHADGRNVDVHVVGEHVYFTYTSFGMLSYRIDELIEPLPEGVDPTEVWRSGGDGNAGFDHRPEHVGKFKLDEVPGYEEYDAEALYTEYTDVGGRLLFYAAYGLAGVAIVDWTDPAVPTLVAHARTVHEATAVSLQNGRLYVADHDGGIAIFK